jgi:signal transduction histidine kinase
MGKAKIMVVEDEAIVALTIRKKLTKHGYDVPLIVDNGADAIKNVKEIEPNLILMDINLKGETDGIETARKIREIYDVPVIFLTAYSDDKTLERAKSATPFGYLIKPYDEKELYSNIEMALSKHQHDLQLKQYRQDLEKLVSERTSDLRESNLQLQNAKDELIKSLDKEKELVKLKSQFISMISHEFRTPLAVISFAQELIPMYIEKQDYSGIKKSATNSLSAVSTLIEFINDCLEINDKDLEVYDVNTSSFKIDYLLNEVIDSIKKENKSTHNIIKSKPDEDLFIRTDRGLLKDILFNIIKNAVIYSPNNSDIIVKVSDHEDKLVIKIIDNGDGISPEDKEKIFDSFFRSKKYVGSIKGIGLGLYIVKKNIEALNGSVLVSSNVEEGSTFEVILTK